MAVNVNWTGPGGSAANEAARRRADAAARRERFAKKQVKAQARTDRETTQKFHREHIQPGTREYAKAMDKLRREVVYTNAEFVLYPERIERWMKMDETAAAIEGNRLNKDYLHSMYNLALKPLDDGLSATGVMECLGAYIGMAVTSPVFRKDCNMNILRAMTPVVETAAKANCKIADFTDSHLHGLIGKVEKLTGKELPGHQARAEYKGHDWHESASVRFIHDMYDKAATHGRLPYTPESAAIQYLRNTTSAYEAMRQPGADIAKILESYNRASEMLYKLAERDGVSEDRLNMNVRTMAGKLIEQYPDFRGIFTETAYHDKAVDKSCWDEVELPGGQTVGTWRGQFVDRATGKPFDGPFTPRPPADASQMREHVRRYCDRAMTHVASMGGFRAAQEMTTRPEWDDKMQYFSELVDSDVPAFCKDYEEADAKVQSDLSKRMIQDIATEFGEEFGARYGYTKEDEEDFRRYSQSQKRGRDVSDMPSVDGEDQYDGSEYV